MATPAITKVYRSVGALYLSPSDLAAAPPYGGTALGIVNEVRLTAATRSFPIEAEEYGGEAVDEVYQGRDWTMTATIRGYDDDTLARLFPNTAAGSSSGQRVISEPGGLLAGSLLIGRVVSLLYAPFRTGDPGFLLYQALPNLRLSSSSKFGLDEDLAFDSVWRAIRDASGRTLQIGLVEDLTL